MPYVIDNETAVLRDILRDVLATHAERSLDVATAYFSVGGFALLRDELKAVGSFRLLLGAEPSSGEQIGISPGRPPHARTHDSRSRASAVR